MPTLQPCVPTLQASCGPSLQPYVSRQASCGPSLQPYVSRQASYVLAEWISRQRSPAAAALPAASRRALRGCTLWAEVEAEAEAGADASTWGGATAVRFPPPATVCTHACYRT